MACNANLCAKVPTRPGFDTYSDDACDTREAVKAAVEAEDFRDTVLAHDRDVDGVSRRQIMMADNDLPSTSDDCEVHRQHLVNDLKQDVEARLDGIAVFDGDVTMEDLKAHHPSSVDRRLRRGDGGAA